MPDVWSCEALPTTDRLVALLVIPAICATWLIAGMVATDGPTAAEGLLAFTLLMAGPPLLVAGYGRLRHLPKNRTISLAVYAVGATWCLAAAAVFVGAIVIASQWKDF